MIFKSFETTLQTFAMFTFDLSAGNKLDSPSL